MVGIGGRLLPSSPWDTEQSETQTDAAPESSTALQTVGPFPVCVGSHLHLLAVALAPPRSVHDLLFTLQGRFSLLPLVFVCALGQPFLPLPRPDYRKSLLGPFPMLP